MRSSLRLVLVLPLFLGLSACQSWWSDDEDSSTATMTEMVVAESQPAMEQAATMNSMVESPLAGWDAFGAPIVSAARVTDAKGFAQVAMDPAAYDGQNMRIVGVVEEVCQTKGCWMTFSAGDQVMRIKFTDYAFFMPMDCAGREAIVDGTFAIEMTPAAEAAHYLEDAGRMEEAALITEDVQTLTFMADSVLMMQN